MKQFFIILALAVFAASAGKVDHTRCGGVGTFRELRIAGCDGSSCTVTAGISVNIEGDLIPSSSSPSLSLKVSTVYLGFPVDITNVQLPGSSVQGGILYVIKFTLVPNDLLGGNTLPITSEHTDSGLVEACVVTNITIRK